ncbi:MAG: flavodoxin [Megasphaera sp.]|jgi:flavodoxin|uniref:flavodoxin n=1 Tax=Megasphaera sueciensis TaxID=349094 RepID=UPI003D02B670|nr:flavodoxin [Megasphaera sp.]MCI1822977.1 flavodoxin [Megasphaera sp.]
MWKKILAGLLIFTGVVTLIACGSVPETMQSQKVDSKVTSSDGKILVVYFSASGNTKRVAETIANQKNAALFAIKPSQSYTEENLNYRNTDSRVMKEHGQPDLRPTYEGDVENWDSYDTVYIGYPLWWQQAPHVVYTFVEHHNFGGKEVIPFCTSSSSPLGTSGTNLAKAAGTGTWQVGIRFSGGVSTTEVLNWLKGK